jgi:hypothetical protein
MTRNRKSRRAAGRRKVRASKKTRRLRRKQRGGAEQGFNDRVPDGALVVVRDADEDSSPFVVMTKEDAMKNYTLGANRL